MTLNLLILKRDLSFLLVLQRILLSKPSLKTIESRVATLHLDLFTRRDCNRKNTIGQSLILKLYFVLIVISNVSIGGSMWLKRAQRCMWKR